MRSDRRIISIIVAAVLSAEMVFSGAAAQNASQPQINYQTPALATQPSVQAMLARLANDGFTYIEVFRTFLGRVRFVAYTETQKREVVINPNSGEILRDLAQENTQGLPEQANANAQENSNNGNGNSGNNGNGNGNSGNGNGNSGNGNGNSGGGNGNGNNGNGKGKGGN